MALVRFHSKAGGDFFFMPDTQKQVFKGAGAPLYGKRCHFS